MRVFLEEWQDAPGLEVIGDLDPADRAEILATRGLDRFDAMAHWAEWRALAGVAVLRIAWELRAEAPSRPFALLGVMPTGAAGVWSAALLARDHLENARALAVLAVHLKTVLPDWAAGRAVHRIEARAWGGHPRAGRLLRGIGFAHECTLPGFHPQGHGVFRQYAWTHLAARERATTTGESDVLFFRPEDSGHDGGAADHSGDDEPRGGAGGLDRGGAAPATGGCRGERADLAHGHPGDREAGGRGVVSGRPKALCCDNCQHFRPDPEPMKFPTGGDGWCERLRRANRQPDPRRTSATTWCENHVPVAHTGARASDAA